jgi:hypothetical protein
MKTLIQQDSQVLYHSEFDDYGILQYFKVDGENELSFSLVKELIPYNVNTLQKIIIGYRQICTTFNLWKTKDIRHSMSKFWCLL